jgi:hypothetical protein
VAARISGKPPPPDFCDMIAGICGPFRTTDPDSSTLAMRMLGMHVHAMGNYDLDAINLG